jgi:DNA-binding CsgD family transcriptional regulator
MVRKRTTAPPVRLLFEVEDAAGRGALILDPRGRLRAGNRTAEALLGERAALQIAAGRLAALDPASDRVLQRALTAVLDPAARTRCERLALSGGDIWIVICVLPMPAGTSSSRGSRETLVLIDDGAATRAARIEGFARCHGLTMAETRLLEEIVAGLPLTEAAARQRRSAHTLRNQLKSILAKSGAERQASLVSLVLGAPHRSSERVP